MNLSNQGNLIWDADGQQVYWLREVRTWPSTGRLSFCFTLLLNLLCHIWQRPNYVDCSCSNLPSSPSMSFLRRAQRWLWTGRSRLETRSPTGTGVRSKMGHVVDVDGRNISNTDERVAGSFYWLAWNAMRDTQDDIASWSLDNRATWLNYEIWTNACCLLMFNLKFQDFYII